MLYLPTVQLTCGLVCQLVVVDSLGIPLGVHVHHHVVVASDLDVLLTYSRTVSLLMERRPAVSFEVDDCGSRAGRVLLVEFFRLRRWGFHAIGGRPEEGTRDVQK